MTPIEFTALILRPGIAWCQAVPGWNVPFDDRAQLMLHAIAGQEANWTDRVQAGNGPAHGFWQMERRGGVVGVMGNKATAQLAYNACEKAGIEHLSAPPVWGVMATDKGDGLATAFARLLLWSDPRPLPNAGNEEAGWEYYLRNWRPGKPSRDRWAAVYPRSMASR